MCSTGTAAPVVCSTRSCKRKGSSASKVPHCYAFYWGLADFVAAAESDPTCFYLTDYLTRHFDRLIMRDFGIERHPQLRDMYFGNYTKVIYLAQTRDPDLEAKAKQAADKLGLAYEYRFTGYGDLGRFLGQTATA